MPRGVVQCMFTTKLARTSNQWFCRGVFSVVHSRFWKFLKHVHNLFTHALWLSSPAGLRLEISCKSDKKKMNLIFNYDKKIFLTGKIKRGCHRENRNRVSKNLPKPKPRPFGIAAAHRLRRLLSAHPELTELACARNFSPLRAKGERSPSCRWRQPIPIPPGVFRCALPVRTSR